MTIEENAELREKIDSEGFDYCFDGYSNWDEIKDKEFHALREAYLDAKAELESYIFDFDEDTGLED